MRKKINQPPDEVSQPTVTVPKTVAGGIPAIVSAVKVSAKQMGLWRSFQTLLTVNQKDGFDCPGCAWPDPDDRRSLVEFCENGAKAVADEAMRRQIDLEFFVKRSLSELSAQSDYWLSQQGRLTHPLWLRAGSNHYEVVPWDFAFACIGKKLNVTNPNEAVFYTSGRTSNEAAFLYQLFVRLYGTNNLPDCSNMCHESSGVALTQTLGSGKGTVRLSDFDHADCILIVGQNPGSNHPRMLTTLLKAARRGCHIISINPLRETGLARFKHPQEIRGLFGKGTALATHHLPVRINGDVALFKGFLKALDEEETQTPGSVFDAHFIDTYTEGFHPFIQDIRREMWANIAGNSGISEDDIRRVAKVIGRSKRLICCWAMGLTQHKNAIANIQEIVNLLLLRGQLGKEGMGVCPVRGHSNVQGDRSMGIWENPSQEFLSALGREFEFQPSEKPGYHTVSAIRAMAEDRVRVLVSLGGNLLSASPDTEYTAQAIQKCDLTVHISTKLNRSHLVTGAESFILPCLGRTEADLQGGDAQFVSVENSMGIVHSSQGTLSPISPHLQSEVRIVANLAEATLGGRIDWRKLCSNYDYIRDHIARVVPGFENFNHRIRVPGGFELPHPVRDARTFKTPSGRAHFTVHPITPIELDPDQYLMMTIRSHDQYNTTVYGLDDRYRGIKGARRVLLMNPQDMERANFTRGEKVNVTSHFNGKRRMAADFSVVDYDIPPGCVASYFPEANVLVPIDSTADKSHTPTSKSIVISVQRK